jgi:hypothetical protein
MQKEYVRLILPWLTRATMTWKRKLVVLNHHLFFDPKKDVACNRNLVRGRCSQGQKIMLPTGG